MGLMKLWHCRDARSFRALWALEELELPYELVMLPFPPRLMQRDYLQVNPLGTVPFFADGEHRLTESAGIVHYLVTTRDTPLNVAPAEPGYGAFLNFLHQSDATLTFPQTIVLRYSQLEPPERRLPQAAGDYARWFAARTVWLENHLSNGREWLAAGRFTAADIAVAYAFLLAGRLGLLDQVGPGIRAWWERCQARPAFARAKLAQGG